MAPNASKIEQHTVPILFSVEVKKQIENQEKKNWRVAKKKLKTRLEMPTSLNSK